MGLDHQPYSLATAADVSRLAPDQSDKRAHLVYSWRIGQPGIRLAQRVTQWLLLPPHTALTACACASRPRNIEHNASVCIQRHATCLLTQLAPTGYSGTRPACMGISPLPEQAASCEALCSTSGDPGGAAAVSRQYVSLAGSLCVELALVMTSDLISLCCYWACRNCGL